MIYWKKKMNRNWQTPNSIALPSSHAIPELTSTFSFVIVVSSLWRKLSWNRVPTAADRPRRHRGSSSLEWRGWIFLVGTVSGRRKGRTRSGISSLMAISCQIIPGALIGTIYIFYDSQVRSCASPRQDNHTDSFCGQNGRAIERPEIGIIRKSQFLNKKKNRAWRGNLNIILTIYY